MYWMAGTDSFRGPPAFNFSSRKIFVGKVECETGRTGRPVQPTIHHLGDPGQNECLQRSGNRCRER